MDIVVMPTKFFKYCLVILYFSLTGCYFSQESSQTAIHSVIFSVNEISKEKLFGYISNFSKENKFRVEIYPTAHNGSYFTIEMRRYDMKIIGGNMMGIGPKDHVSLAIYDDLKSSTSHSKLEEIFGNFVREAGEISGVSIVQRN